MAGCYIMALRVSSHKVASLRWQAVCAQLTEDFELFCGHPMFLPILSTKCLLVRTVVHIYVSRSMFHLHNYSMDFY